MHQVITHFTMYVYVRVSEILEFSITCTVWGQRLCCPCVDHVGEFSERFLVGSQILIAICIQCNPPFHSSGSLCFPLWCLYIYLSFYGSVIPSFPIYKSEYMYHATFTKLSILEMSGLV